MTLPQATVPNAATAPSVTLGPGQARLVVFFATWLSETSDLNTELTGLNGYVKDAASKHLPALTAVDETVTESSALAVSSYLGKARDARPTRSALDETGRLADGYGVQDQPWLRPGERGGQDHLAARRLGARSRRWSRPSRPPPVTGGAPRRRPLGDLPPFEALALPEAIAVSPIGHVEQQPGRVQVPGDRPDHPARQVLRAAWPAVPAAVDPVQRGRMAAGPRPGLSGHRPGRQAPSGSSSIAGPGEAAGDGDPAGSLIPLAAPSRRRPPRRPPRRPRQAARRAAPRGAAG